MSLFERLTRAPTCLVAHMLDTQYRMHPAISAFPARYFYKGRPRDGACVGGEAWHQSWHGGESPLGPPLLFLDLANSAESGGSGLSRSNEPEARLVVALYQVRGGQALAVDARVLAFPSFFPLFLPTAVAGFRGWIALAGCSSLTCLLLRYCCIARRCAVPSQRSNSPLVAASA